MSNLAKRILVALVAIPVILLLCMAGRYYFFLFIAAASALALIEYYRLAAAKGAKPLVVPGVVAGFAVNLSFYYPGVRTGFGNVMSWFGWMLPFPSQTQLLMMVLIVSVVVITLIELFRNNGSALLNLSTTFFGIIYISLFFGTVVGLRQTFIPSDFPLYRYFPLAVATCDPAIVTQIDRWGGYTIISVLATIWICDTAAYHIGSIAGKHKLYPRVSPNKSWEGAIAGFIAAIASAVAAKYIVLGYLPLSGAIIIGLIVGTIGQLGDLAESLLKRDAGVKDSSTLLPGHGGIFDRFDSLLLVAPCVYLYIDYILFS